MSCAELGVTCSLPPTDLPLHPAAREIKNKHKNATITDDVDFFMLFASVEMMI